MKIDRIKIKNFKCYNEVDIDLSSLTLITGANSSGKSALLYSILGAIQSQEFPFQFSPNGKYVNMGDFTEIVHQHKNDDTILLEFEYLNDYNEPETISTSWVIDNIRKLPILQLLIAKTSYYFLKIEKIRKYDLSFEYFHEKDPNKALRSPKMFSKMISTMEGVFSKATNTPEDKVILKLLNRFDNVKNKVSFKFSDISELGSLIRDDGNFYLDHIIQEIFKNFNKYDENINYISSFRLFPERTYYETSKSNLKVGKFGENYEDQIIAWETLRHQNYKKLCDILKELDLLEEIKSQRLSGGRYEILVKNKKDGIWSSIADVGFGISQFLPIIVADLQLSKNSTLFIAQPEIHLHPKVQAQFADYIINRVKKDNKCYIIETHSEYLINRLRLAICDRKISEKDVSVYYIENNGNIAKKYNIELLKNGQIRNAPSSFFDTYMLDVMNIALNAQTE